jgi:ParB-like chromosome segregation protein Spo0J
VKKFGVLQPVLVAREPKPVTGCSPDARRAQAARDAGLADVPALIIPPDRAGELDVFLEENLNRADLSEFDRLRLRDQWMRETGRDAEDGQVT